MTRSGAHRVKAFNMQQIFLTSCVLWWRHAVLSVLLKMNIFDHVFIKSHTLMFIGNCLLLRPNYTPNLRSGLFLELNAYFLENGCRCQVVVFLKDSSVHWLHLLPCQQLSFTEKQIFFLSPVKCFSPTCENVEKQSNLTDIRPLKEKNRHAHSLPCQPIMKWKHIS